MSGWRQRPSSGEWRRKSAAVVVLDAVEASASFAEGSRGQTSGAGAGKRASTTPKRASERRLASVQPGRSPSFPALSPSPHSASGPSNLGGEEISGIDFVRLNHSASNGGHSRTDAAAEAVEELVWDGLQAEVDQWVSMARELSVCRAELAKTRARKQEDRHTVALLDHGAKGLSNGRLAREQRRQMA